MRSLIVFYGGGLKEAAFGELFSGKSAFSLALERGCCFPGVEKAVLLGKTGTAYPGLPEDVGLIVRDDWTRKAFLETLASLSGGTPGETPQSGSRPPPNKAPSGGGGFDLTYLVWADCPFLDPRLAGKLAERHLRYAAEYSYADGWPYGLSPEILAPGAAGILAALAGGLALAGEGSERVERDTLFQVIQKDINAFDIETEISPVDLRCHRLSLAADSRASALLLKRFFEAGLSGGAELGGAAERVTELIEKRPELLRTLPNFYPIQVSGPCAQACSL